MKLQSSAGISSALGLLYTLLPVLLLVFGFFFFCSLFLNSRINKTVDEVVNINKSVTQYFNGNYKNFDTKVVVGHGVLPFELNGGDYTLQNRFGGQIIFYEAMNTNAERLLYISLLKEPEKYKEIYGGVTAYAVLYTGLSHRECRRLSTVDWRKYINNFVGLEVSNLTPEEKSNGVYNLRMQLLQEGDLYPLVTKDYGKVSREPLTDNEAEEFCKCSFFNDTCTVALKFN